MMTERCAYHKDRNWFFRSSDVLVAYAEAVRVDDEPFLLFEDGTCTERVAQARKGKYAITLPTGAYAEVVFLYSEISGDRTFAVNGLLRQLGIEYRITEMPKDYWLQQTEAFIRQLPAIPAVREAYLVGSLASGKEKARDADILVVLDGCEERCPLATVRTKLDLFCFTPQEFERLKADDFKITENMQLLYRR